MASRKPRKAANADGRYGQWQFAMAASIDDVSYILHEAERPANPVEAARAWGIDIGLLDSSLRRTPDERLRDLDANMTFLEELRGRIEREGSG